MIRELAVFERLEQHAAATEVDLQRALFGESPRVWALLAEQNGEAVGYAIWFYNFSTFTGRHGLYVEDVYVAPAWRGQGVGRTIFRHLARRAVMAGCARMEWAVLTWNEDAIRFYRSLGARPKDEWQGQQLAGAALSALAA
jgi:GNAT superfamily N-acetyltransferase